MDLAGSLTTPPSVSGSIQGHGVFDYNDVTTGKSGRVQWHREHSHDGLGDVDQRSTLRPIYQAPTLRRPVRLWSIG